MKPLLEMRKLMDTDDLASYRTLQYRYRTVTAGLSEPIIRILLWQVPDRLDEFLTESLIKRG